MRLRCVGVPVALAMTVLTLQDIYDKGHTIYAPTNPDRSFTMGRGELGTPPMLTITNLDECKHGGPVKCIVQYDIDQVTVVPR